MDSDGDVAATVMSAVKVGSPRVVRRRVGAARLYPNKITFSEKCFCKGGSESGEIKLHNYSDFNFRSEFFLKFSGTKFRGV